MAGHIRFATSSFTLLCLALLVACEAAVESPPAEAGEGDDFRALTNERGDHFEVVTWPREATGPAMRSSGYLIVRLMGGPASTGPATPPTATGIQGTCGVTFVSPRLAVTAGHCLPGMAEGEQVEVRVARALPGTDPTGEISGSFPDYTHPSSPGYEFDDYLCEVRSRCWEDEPGINCDITPAAVPVLPAGHIPDIAIIECDAVHGGQHDYVDVTETVAVDDEVAMPWYHELYDPSSLGVDPLEFNRRYVLQPPLADTDGDGEPEAQYQEHYHYRGGGVRHEMLPLMSTDYYGSRWDVRDLVGARVWTNLRGCHGTSGSGVMKKDSAFYPELIGPVTRGAGSLAGRLCHQADADTDSASTIETVHPDITRYFVEKYLPADCSDPDSYPSRLAYWLDCDILTLDDLIYQPRELFPWDCPWCPLFARISRPSNMGMEISTAQPTKLALRPNVAGELHRASVRVWLNEFPTTVELRLGNQVLAERVFEGQDPWVGNDSSGVLAASFVPENTSDTLTIAVTQGSAATSLRLSDIVLVRDAADGAFDTMHDRLGFGLVGAYDQVPQAVPMTFGGSAQGGIAALLDKDERMLATGLALVEDRQWFVLPTGDDVSLRCGMIFADGSELSATCHGNEGITLDASGRGQPLALFVENTQGADAVSLTDLIVDEQDGCTPVAHDPCTTGSAMAEPSCDACVDSICAADPYCCSTYWDSTCVGEVLTVCGDASCPSSQGACPHGICQSGEALVSGCDAPPISPSCTAQICNVDPYCCNTFWDSICVGEVGSVCGLSC